MQKKLKLKTYFLIVLIIVKKIILNVRMQKLVLKFDNPYLKELIKWMMLIVNSKVLVFIFQSTVQFNK